VTSAGSTAVFSSEPSGKLTASVSRPAVPTMQKLSDVLAKLDEPSLSQLIRDHEAGKLEQICRAA
jgi:hypothetical protein